MKKIFILTILFLTITACAKDIKKDTTKGETKTKIEIKKAGDTSSVNIFSVDFNK